MGKGLLFAIVLCLLLSVCASAVTYTSTTVTAEYRPLWSFEEIADHSTLNTMPVDDVNLDGVRDVVLFLRGYLSNVLKVHLFSGSDGLEIANTTVWIPDTNYSEKLLLIDDVSGDGYRDIVVCAFNASALEVHVLSGSDLALLGSASLPFSGGVTKKEMMVCSPGDLDGDTVPDLLAGIYTRDQYTVTGGYQWYGNISLYALSCPTLTAIWNGSSGSESTTTSTFFYPEYRYIPWDATGDGVSDVLILNTTGTSASVHLLNGTNGALVWTLPLQGSKISDVAVGNFTAWGESFVISVVSDTGSTLYGVNFTGDVYLMHSFTGLISFCAQYAYSMSPSLLPDLYYRPLDLNGDGLQDLGLNNISTTWVYNNYTLFSPAANTTLGTVSYTNGLSAPRFYYYGAVLPDVNGDGVNDTCVFRVSLEDTPDSVVDMYSSPSLTPLWSVGGTGADATNWLFGYLYMSYAEGFQTVTPCFDITGDGVFDIFMLENVTKVQDTATMNATLINGTAGTTVWRTPLTFQSNNTFETCDIEQYVMGDANNDGVPEVTVTVDMENSTLGTRHIRVFAMNGTAGNTVWNVTFYAEDMQGTAHVSVYSPAIATPFGYPGTGSMDLNGNGEADEVFVETAYGIYFYERNPNFTIPELSPLPLLAPIALILLFRRKF